jgi:hypothetical protein
MPSLPSEEGAKAQGKRREMEALWTQLAHLKEKIGTVEEGIYHLATEYSRLPWGLRNDTRISKAARKNLEDLFFEADEDAQERFWGREVAQARFVASSLEETVGWCEKMREDGHLKKEHVGPGGYFPLDRGLASQAVCVAMQGLATIDKKTRQLHYELSVFSLEEREKLYAQEWEEMEKCFEGARRFLTFWPAMERHLKGGKSLNLLVGEFLEVEVEMGMEDRDSGVFLEHRF